MFPLPRIDPAYVSLLISGLTAGIALEKVNGIFSGFCIKLAVYLVEDEHELASQSFYRHPKIIHPYLVGIGGSPHPSDNSSFTFYFLQHSQFAKAC